MIEDIQDPDDNRLDVFRSLKSSNAVRDARVFIAEGPTVVERVLKSDYQVTGIVISERKWAGFRSHIPDDVPVYRLRQDLADRLAGFRFHCGVMASVLRRPAEPLDQILRATGPSLIIAGERIADPENVGSLVRIGAAFGASGVLLSRGSADPFSRRVLRVSMGNVLFLPVMESRDLAVELREMQSRQYAVCAATLAKPACCLQGFSFPNRTVLVFGNEFDGLSERVLEVADHRLTIPMQNGTDSLNVAVSAGIFAWQYRKQYQ